jgi:hypothetical protein
MKSRRLRTGVLIYLVHSLGVFKRTGREKHDVTKLWKHTVCKMDLILRPIERRPQLQFSIARKFKLQLLRRYSEKFSQMHNFFTLGTP